MDAKVELNNHDFEYHVGAPEYKTIKRTISFVDEMTGEEIPGVKPIVQKVNFTRSPILNQEDQVIGYGQLNGSAQHYIAQNWSADQNFARVKTPDLSKRGYTAPSRAIITAEIPNSNLNNGHVEHIIVTYNHVIKKVTTNPIGLPYKRTVTRIVRYQGANQRIPDHIDQLNFSGVGRHDEVTGDWLDKNNQRIVDLDKIISWKLEGSNRDWGVFPAVPSQTIKGYVAEVPRPFDDGAGNVRAISGITHRSRNIYLTVTYGFKKIKTASANIIIHDQTSGKNLEDYGYLMIDQPETSKITYNWDLVKKQLIAKGYEIVTKQVKIPKTIGSHGFSLTIEVKHRIKKLIKQKEYHQIVHFINENGRAVHDDIVQTSHWQQISSLDEVLNKSVSGKWQVDLQHYDNVAVPKVPGYTNKIKMVPGEAVVAKDIVKTVHYDTDILIPSEQIARDPFEALKYVGLTGRK